MEKSCCFIGHREIEDAEKIKDFLRGYLITLIEQGYTRFIFGSRSYFNYICLNVVDELKEKYPDIKRIAYLTKSSYGSKELYDEFYKPDFVYNSGKAVYVERDRLMIDESDLCIFYYNKDYKPPVKLRSKKYLSGLPTSRQSGTELALIYAKRKKKEIVNIYELI